MRFWRKTKPICSNCGRRNDHAFNQGEPGIYCDNEECKADLHQQRLDRLMNYDPRILRMFSRVMAYGFPLIVAMFLSHSIVGIEDGRIVWGIAIPLTALLWWRIDREDWY